MRQFQGSLGPFTEFEQNRTPGPAKPSKNAALSVAPESPCNPDANCGGYPDYACEDWPECMHEPPRANHEPLSWRDWLWVSFCMALAFVAHGVIGWALL